jgi:hypothetical protein
MHNICTCIPQYMYCYFEDIIPKEKIINKKILKDTLQEVSMFFNYNH